MKKFSCLACLLGPPASGKGTCATALSEHYNVPIITPGDIYRKLREEDTYLGKRVQEALKDGGYCPDEMTNELMLNEMKKHSRFILDGYPRTANQLAFLLNYCNVDSFIYLDSHYDNLLRAALNRVQCSKCKKVFSKAYSSSFCDCWDDKGVESRPGGSVVHVWEHPKWIERFDDTLEIFPKRYEVYMKSTVPILEITKQFENYKQFELLYHAENLQSIFDFINSLIS